MARDEIYTNHESYENENGFIQENTDDVEDTLPRLSSVFRMSLEELLEEIRRS